MNNKYLTDYEYIATSKYFNKVWYLKTYPDVARHWKRDAVFHYLEIGWKEGRNPGPYFDNNRYLQLYKKFNEENLNPLLHYEKYGKDMGLQVIATPYVLIQKSAYFNWRWYRRKYLKGKKEDPVLHYLKIGWKEGNNPSKKFDGNKYLEKYQGVKNAGLCPLLHYERSGKYEGRVVFPGQAPQYKEKGKLYLLVQKSILKFKNLTLPLELKEKRILVCLHLFYPEAWKEIKDYLNNLSCYQYDLCVSYPVDSVNEQLLKQIRKFHNRVYFFPCENRGYDVGPFLEVLNAVDLKDYDIVFKLHSKGIKRPELFMYGQFFKNKEWFTLLFRGTVGIFNAHKTIKDLSGKDSIGMAACKNLIVDDPSHKRNLVQMWCEQLQIDMLKDYKFVAGTCFAVRAELLNELLNMNLRLQDFDITTRGEFSLAHAVERIMCMNIQKAGYVIKGNPVILTTSLLRKHEANKRKCYSSLKLLEDERFILDDNFFYRILEGKQLEKYEVVKVPLKDIRRIWEGKRIPLTQCQPYRYLMGYQNEYFDYCDIHREGDLPLMTKQRFDDLIQSIEENGFNDKYKIVINQDNILQDGQHRACCYLYKYGEEFELEVLKVYYRGQGILK